MTKEEIQAKVDEAVISFYNEISPFQITIVDIEHYRYGGQFEIATQCAILMYERDVRMLEKLIYKEATFEGVPQRFHDWLNDSQSILENLKERVK